MILQTEKSISFIQCCTKTAAPFSHACSCYLCHCIPAPVSHSEGSGTCRAGSWYGHSSGESSGRFYQRTPYRSQDRETACLPLEVLENFPAEMTGPWVENFYVMPLFNVFLGWTLSRTQDRRDCCAGGQGSWCDDIWYVVFLHVSGQLVARRGEVTADIAG